MKNYVTMGGGLLTAISMFLPFVSLGELSVKGIDRGGIAYFFIACGVIMMIVGFLGNKMLNILSLLLGLVVAGLAIKYKMDAGDMTGMGIWMMLAGGVLGVVGSVMGLMKKAA